MKLNISQIISAIVALSAIASLFIEISPIKIYPLRALGRLLNSDTNAKVDKLEKQFEEHVVIDCRARILRFGDEIARGIKHTQEHFEQILSDIDNYELFCDKHADFKNNMTKITTSLIKDVYKQAKADNDFI